MPSEDQPANPDGPPKRPGGKKTPRLGRYKVEALLGRGGMGRVYRGFDPELQRRVALKIVNPELLSDNRIIDRFRQEAVSVARLNHPGIVQIYEFNSKPPTPFFAMEYVEGSLLADILARQGAFALDRAFEIILEAVDALEYAFQKGIIHRDIKPGNIFITDEKRVKLLDFGLARCVTGNSDLTQTGTVIGSPHYMAPEQAEGKKVDLRSDIYALGITFFHMITGQRPFQADTPLAIMMRHVNEPLPPWPMLDTMLDGRVRHVLDKMAEKSPEERFQTYPELRAVLESLVGQMETREMAISPVDISEMPTLDGITALPDSRASQPTAFKSPKDRHKMWWIAAVLLALVAGGVLWTSLTGPDPLPPRSANVTASALYPSPEPRPTQPPLSAQDTPTATPLRVYNQDPSMLRSEIERHREAATAKLASWDFAGALHELSEIQRTLENQGGQVSLLADMEKRIAAAGELVDFKHALITCVNEANRPVAVRAASGGRFFVREADEAGIKVTENPEGPERTIPWHMLDKELLIPLVRAAWHNDLPAEQVRQLRILGEVLQLDLTRPTPSASPTYARPRRTPSDRTPLERPRRRPLLDQRGAR